MSYGGDKPNLDVAATPGGDPKCVSLDTSQRLDKPSLLGRLQEILATD
jgi:hypothetical protein